MTKILALFMLCITSLGWAQWKQHHEMTIQQKADKIFYIPRNPIPGVTHLFAAHSHCEDDCVDKLFSYVDLRHHDDEAEYHIKLWKSHSKKDSTYYLILINECDFKIREIDLGKFEAKFEGDIYGTFEISKECLEHVKKYNLIFKGE